MQIKNLTKKTNVASSCQECTTIFQKTLGLMFSSKPRPLLFTFKKEKIIALHMFFVKFPIDVIFIDTDKKIVEIKENFKPWSYYKPKNKAMYVLELPQGTIKNTKTSVDDALSFE